MVNILIVNPSVNMRLAAMEMKMYGANVKFAYSSDIPASSAERVFYFLSSVNICFTTEIQGEMEREDRVYLFKRNIFSRFKIMGFKKNMEMSYPELSVGTFTDLLLFKRSVLRNDESQEHVGMIQYTSFNDVLANNRDSFIITSRIVGQGSESVCIWETDFDLASTFNKDYFVFFANNRRIEAYAAGDKLVTIGRGSGDKHLEALTALIPMISKFSFKKESLDVLDILVLTYRSCSIAKKIPAISLCVSATARKFAHNAFWHSSHRGSSAFLISFKCSGSVI